MRISHLKERMALRLAVLSSCIAILILIPPLTQTERISDKIYTTLQSNHYCSRRLNATHQMGCTSQLGGNFGVVWLVDGQNDLNHILKDGPTPPYIAVLGRNFFTKKNLLDFRDQPDRVSGVVFTDVEHEDSKLRALPFSPDDVCPNRYSGLYVNDTKYDGCKQNNWQNESPISGLLYENIPYPVFLMNEKQSIDDIHNCFKEHNVIYSTSDISSRRQATYPLCGIQLDSFMTAAQNSDLCLNSHLFIDELLQSNGRRCYPVDNHNIFAYYKSAFGPLQPTNITNLVAPDIAAPKSIVMLAAKLSSLSMFSEISPGADSTITSIITLLAVAESLSHVKNSTIAQKSSKNIVFALLDSEPFDYTGSNKMIHNMLSDTFPNSHFIKRTDANIDAMQNTNLKSIEYIINLDQMANYPSADSVHFHSEPNEPNTEKLEQIFKVMNRVASSEKVVLRREDDQLPLPPTPVQEFIKQSRAQKYARDLELTGLVLSNYGRTYSNLFYHSIYDDSHNIYQTSKVKLVDHIAQVSKFIARSLFEVAFKTDESSEIRVDKSLIDQLLECYLIDAQCHLFTRVSAAGQKLPVGPIQTYKDPTKRSDDINGVITAHLLAYFLGDKMPDLNLTKCVEANQRDLIYNFEYVNGKDDPIEDGSSGVCIRSQVAMLSSESPAWSQNPEEGRIDIDQHYPAWTVSLNSIRSPVRLYLMPSPVTRWVTFLLGLVITIASFVVVYQVKDSIAKAHSEESTIQIATSA